MTVKTQDNKSFTKSVRAKSTDYLSNETKLPYMYLSIYLPNKVTKGGFKGVLSW